MRSSVFDRAKESGFLTAPGHPLTRSMDRLPAMRASGPGSSSEPPPDPDEDEEEPSAAPPGEYAPASDDEGEPTSPAAEASSPHGTVQKPLDLVGGKAVIRLDDGQLLQLSFLSPPSSFPSGRGAASSIPLY